MNLQAGRLRATALAWAREVEPGQLERGPTGVSRFADALDALGTAIRACKLNLRTTTGEWELAVALTDGLICSRPP